MAYNVWTAKQSIIKLGLASGVTITGSAALDTYFSGTSVIQGVLKDVTVSEPLPDVEQIDLAGVDANDFQNASIEEKPAPMYEVSGTLILPGDEVVENFLYDGGSAVGGTHTRYIAGKATRRKLAFLLNLDDSTDEVSYAGDNAYSTARETKLTGADGHYETTFTLKGLARDWYGPEFKD